MLLPMCFRRSSLHPVLRKGRKWFVNKQHVSLNIASIPFFRKVSIPRHLRFVYYFYCSSVYSCFFFQDEPLTSLEAKRIKHIAENEMFNMIGLVIIVYYAILFLYGESHVTGACRST